MQPPEGHGLPHDPAPPQARHVIPERPLLVRGVALLIVAVAALYGLVAAVQKTGWLAVPLVPPLVLTAVLAAWSAVIHLTGGQRFDDHPWV